MPKLTQRDNGISVRPKVYQTNLIQVSVAVPVATKEQMVWLIKKGGPVFSDDTRVESVQLARSFTKKDVAAGKRSRIVVISSSSDAKPQRLSELSPDGGRIPLRADLPCLTAVSPGMRDLQSRLRPGPNTAGPATRVCTIWKTPKQDLLSHFSLSYDETWSRDVRSRSQLRRPEAGRTEVGRRATSLSLLASRYLDLGLPGYLKEYKQL